MSRPNPGFMAQLKLFEQMGCQIDNKCHAYRQFMTQQKNVDKLGNVYFLGTYILVHFFFTRPFLISRMMNHL